MMDFSESPLKVLADDIADAKTNGGLYKWEVKFKLKDTSPVDLTDEKLVYTDEEKDGFFEPLSLMNLDIVSNYLIAIRINSILFWLSLQACGCTSSFRLEIIA